MTDAPSTIIDRERTDEELLAVIEHKLELVRDRTRGVAQGYSNGFYLWGEGGTSKSYTVEQTLKELHRHYRLTNSRVTGKGLFVLLRDYPDVVHVLEDVETLFSDKNAFGVLRAALWGQQNEQGRQERTVVWQTGAEREEVVFEGGIILIANRPLDDLPELRAVGTRIACVHYLPTAEEIAALMRKVASKGYRCDPHELSPEECLEVAAAITDRSARLERHPDMRLLVNSFMDRLQWANGDAEMHWLELLESRLRQRVLPPKGRPERREERKAREMALVRRIADLPQPERLAAWKAQTSKSRAGLYRLLDELKSQVSNSVNEA